MRRTPADVVIVGGGIAGWSAAYFARRAGRDVTLIDAGVDRASDLPVALINPLRGHTGRLVADGVEGLAASVALIDALRDAGHAVTGGRGLFRPLVDVVGEPTGRAYWTERIGSRLAFDWHDVAPASLGLAAPVPALFVRDAAWVVPRTLLDALRSASGATVVAERATAVQPRRWLGGSIRLAGGATLDARTLLWCGGARARRGWTAGRRGRRPRRRRCVVQAGQPRRRRAAHRPRTDVVRPVRDPVASRARRPAGRRDAGRPDTRGFAVALSGRAGRGRRGRTDSWIASPTRSVSACCQGRSGAACGSRGCRPRRVPRCRGVSTLTELDSRGFLMAPLLAARWAPLCLFLSSGA